MTRASELLDSLTEDQISTYLANPDTEEHIVVGNDRFITVPESLKRIAVQHDHNVETVTFDCPRYWDGLDMSAMAIYVNYERSDRTPGTYIAKNVKVDENDTSVMHFEWTIDRHVTLTAGSLTINVCIKKTDSEGIEENHWNSEKNMDMYVSPGMEGAKVPEDVQSDLIAQLTGLINQAESNNQSAIDKLDTANNLFNEANTKFGSAEQVLNDVHDSIKQEVENATSEPIKNANDAAERAYKAAEEADKFVPDIRYVTSGVDMGYITTDRFMEDYYNDGYGVTCHVYDDNFVLNGSILAKQGSYVGNYCLIAQFDAKAGVTYRIPALGYVYAHPTNGTYEIVHLEVAKDYASNVIGSGYNADTHQIRPFTVQVASDATLSILLRIRSALSSGLTFNNLAFSWPVVTTSTTKITLEDKYDYRLRNYSHMILDLPGNVADYFTCIISFISDDIGAYLDYPSEIIMSGSDCYDGVFTPVKNTLYDIVIRNNGFNVRGFVSGVSVS